MGAETKVCLVDEADNVVIELEPYRYGYIIPEEYSVRKFILSVDDIYKVKRIEFEVEE